MKVTRDNIESYLPCYVCGDMPEAMVAAIDAIVHTDDALRARVDVLRASRDLCRDTLLQRAPSEDAPPEPVAPAPQRVFPIVGLSVAVVAVLLTALATEPAPGPTIAARHALANDDRDILRAATSDGLSALLVQAGVLPSQACVPDLSQRGLTLVGAHLATLSTPTLLVYEADGQRYTLAHTYTRPPAAHPTHVQTVGGVVIRGYSEPSGTWVEWTHHGTTHQLTGPLPLPQLIEHVANTVLLY